MVSVQFGLRATAAGLTEQTRVTEELNRLSASETE